MNITVNCRKYQIIEFDIVLSIVIFNVIVRFKSQENIHAILHRYYQVGRIISIQVYPIYFEVPRLIGIYGMPNSPLEAQLNGLNLLLMIHYVNGYVSITNSIRYQIPCIDF
jgi:hypothetical protein